MSTVVFETVYRHLCVSPIDQTAAEMSMRTKQWLFATLALALAAGAGLATGYVLWGWPVNWYAGHDLAKLPPGPESELIRYGWRLLAETPRHIGKSATDAAKRYAGNDLACTDCHINSGLKPFAAPLVSTFTSYPMMADDRVLTLAERINGCMTRSMNGSPMPEDGREMEALIAYMRFIGEDSPQGVRVAGMGLKPLRPPWHLPDAGRGQAVYLQHCAGCHRADGEGQPALPPAVGFTIPPLWGDGSFNAAAGMAKLETAAAFIHANMPVGADYRVPVLSEQEAWDVAAYVIAQPRPGPRNAMPAR
jgi:thiosulfate dehydrogenase